MGTSSHWARADSRQAWALCWRAGELTLPGALAPQGASLGPARCVWFTLQRTRTLRRGVGHSAELTGGGGTSLLYSEDPSIPPTPGPLVDSPQKPAYCPRAPCPALAQGEALLPPSLGSGPRAMVLTLQSAWCRVSGLPQAWERPPDSASAGAWSVHLCWIHCLRKSR